MRPSIEKELIKKEVLLNKKDILNKINYLKEDTSLEDSDLVNLDKISEKLENVNLPRIGLNLDKEKIDSYFIEILDGTIYKATLSEFYFEYDNTNHELYLASFISDTEDDPII